MAIKLREIHPGEILAEEFLKPIALTNARLASDIDVPASRISEIVNGKRPITVDTALRLGLYFKMEPHFWLRTRFKMSRARHRDEDSTTVRRGVVTTPCSF